MKIANLDHLVLTVTDLEATTRFYCGVLGMSLDTFGQGRLALHYGSGEGRGKINLHLAGHEFEPKARLATPGSADLCFLTNDSLEVVLTTLRKQGAKVELGPVERTSARGQMDSLYVRDPDGNLVEIGRLRD